MERSTQQQLSRDEAARAVRMDTVPIDVWDVHGQRRCMTLSIDAARELHRHLAEALGVEPR